MVLAFWFGVGLGWVGSNKNEWASRVGGWSVRVGVEVEVADWRWLVGLADLA